MQRGISLRFGFMFRLMQYVALALLLVAPAVMGNGLSSGGDVSANSISSRRTEKEGRMSMRFDGEAPAPATPMMLWYRSPASRWVEALPVGNGRLGGMVFGDVAAERIALNDATLWSGTPVGRNAPEAAHLMPEMRKAVLSGDLARAEDIARKQQGPWTEAYMPLGDLLLTFSQVPSVVTNYRRTLELHRALQATRYVADGVTYTREVFASAPDQVIVVRLSADQHARVSFSASLNTQLGFRAVRKEGGDVLVLTGKAPANALPNYRGGKLTYADDPDGEGMNFEVRLKAVSTGGTVHIDGESLRVDNADAVTLLVAARTSYGGSQRSPGLDGLPTSPRVQQDLAAAAARSFDQLLERHAADFRSLFDRVSLDLGEGATASLETSERVRQWAQTRDPQVVSLLFQYGRYLLISSSRPDGIAANLQGIWNDSPTPPWSSNYTTNINAEMNYWPAETTNLADCHQPLFAQIAAAAISGAKTARDVYGARGWVVHHNSDIWGTSWAVGAGQGGMDWSPWPMGGAWLADHLWQHYAFSRDMEFLRKSYPLMKGAAEFCLDLLIEDDAGRLVTIPSTSPETPFRLSNGERRSLTAGATMDMAIIRELFKHTSEAAGILGIDAALAKQLDDARSKLAPYQVSADGTLAEWANPTFKAVDPRHRHVSHLIGLFPLADINFDQTELIHAIKKTLAERGDDSTGWSLGWKLNLWARLRDGEHCHELLKYILRPVGFGGAGDKTGGVYLNLFGAHPPFQIDGNFGLTSGIAEMLLQSHDGTIRLLPALPAAWANGSVKGLRARGGFEIDIEWAAGRLVRAQVRSIAGEPCTVGYRDREIRLNTTKGQAIQLSGELTVHPLPLGTPTHSG